MSQSSTIVEVEEAGVRHNSSRMGSMELLECHPSSSWSLDRDDASGESLSLD